MFPTRAKGNPVAKSSSFLARYPSPTKSLPSAISALTSCWRHSPPIPQIPQVGFDDSVELAHLNHLVAQGRGEPGRNRRASWYAVAHQTGSQHPYSVLLQQRIDFAA